MGRLEAVLGKQSHEKREGGAMTQEFDKGRVLQATTVTVELAPTFLDGPIGDGSDVGQFLFGFDRRIEVKPLYVAEGIRSATAVFKACEFATVRVVGLSGEARTFYLRCTSDYWFLGHELPVAKSEIVAK